MSRRTATLIGFYAALPVTTLLFQLTIRTFGALWGYWTAFALYWAMLMTGALASMGIAGIRRLYAWDRSTKPLWMVLALLPVFPTFFVAFWPSMDRLDATLWLLLTAAACLNGTLEELFWRGLPLHFGKTGGPVYLVSSFIGFSSWHVTLTMLPGIHYQGGAPALLGGALVMGALWLLVTLKTRSILLPTLAHVLVNFFAFSALLVDNWGV